MSENKAFKGDYLGFTYKGKHSSTLGIVRTSDGSRFNENLLPTMQDKTVQVPGGDGTYYFGSYYTQRPFNISFAFDSLTEQQVAELKTHFGDKKIHELIFDETPYKAYRAKVTGTATMKYIPFNEGEGKERIYKGEGTIQFTCYQPYAICNKKWLDEYVEKVENADAWEEGLYEFDVQENRFERTKDSSWDDKKNYYKNIGNINEWATASGMKESNQGYNTYNNGSILLYNPGDLETDFLLTLRFNKDGKIPATGIGLVKNAEAQLNWEEISAQGYDTHLVINTKINLIEGYQEETKNNKTYLKKTGNIYNKHITSGQFFKIPVGEEEMTGSGLSEVEPQIEYDYYYF